MGSVFCLDRFEAESVEAFETRNGITINDSFGLFMFVYSWISGPIWHCIGLYLLQNDGIEGNPSCRDLETMHKSENYSEILELAEFGLPMTSDNQEWILKACICELNEYSRDFVEKIIKKSGTSEAEFIDDDELLHFAVQTNKIKAMKYLIDKGCDVNKKDKY